MSTQTDPTAAALEEELANAVCQLTWRMAAFGSVLLSAGFAFARFF